MPSTVFVKDEVDAPVAGTSIATAVNLSSLIRDGSRSAFTPYRPATVLTNLQRGNIQTQSPAILHERSLHQLAAQGELFVDHTVEKNFDHEQRDQQGFTPLMWACSYGQLSTVQKLIQRGASISSFANAGENALILASAAGHAAIVKELINHGATVDYKDEDGNTALMHAVYCNSGNCVQELLNAGADMTAVNEALETAFDIAVKKRSKHAQAIMEKHMLNPLQVDTKS